MVYPSDVNKYKFFAHRRSSIMKDLLP